MMISTRMWCGIVAGPVIAALLSIAGSWWFFGRHSTWAGEIRQIVERYSPYAVDRERIWTALTQLHADLVAARAEASDVRAAQNLFTARVGIVEAKLAAGHSSMSQHRQKIFAQLDRIETRLVLCH